MTPEGRIKQKIKKVLDAHLNVFYRMPVPIGYGKQGIDFYGCVQGRYFGIEAKAPDKEPTILQKNTIKEIERAGGMVFVIDDDSDVRLLDLWLTQRGIA